MPEKQLEALLLCHTPEPETAIALAGRLCYSDSDVLSLKEAVEGKSEKFISRILSMGHLSPIEHASFTFAAQGVSRALLAQITRHRIASFSVQSQRYVKKDALDFIVPPSIRALGEEAELKYIAQMEQCQAFYQGWLERGIPAEDARFLLPNGAETRMVFTMNARELMHFFSLRCCNRAQWEIRALAWAMLGMCLREAPALFAKSGPSCISGACPEGKMSCGKAEAMRATLDKLKALASYGADDAEITRFARENCI